ncbi:MAG TPA: hypothetical protein VEL07_02610 [Planctomycetota bacterium]|nr:hypothetical protein [Planctomycetota bacterium]
MRHHLRVAGLWCVLVAAGGLAHAADSGASGAELILWARATDLTLDDGQPVGRWTDASGRANDLVTIDGIGAPTYRATGESGGPTVAFSSDHNADPKRLQGLRLRQPLIETRGLAVFVVGTGLHHGHWFGSAPGNNGELRVLSFSQVCGTAVGGPAFAALPATPGPHLAAVVAAVGADGAMRYGMWGDGAKLHEATDPAPAIGVMIGDTQFGSYLTDVGMTGEMSEIVVYRGALSDAERELTQRYLLTKHGLSAAKKGDPTAPALFAPKTQAKLAAVTGEPITKGLRVWARAEDLTLDDRAEVATWPNAVDPKRPLTAPAGRLPSLVREALAGRPVVRFAPSGDGENRRVHVLQLPLTGDWQEMTMVVVGSGLNNAGMLDTAPGDGATLRHLGSCIQHCAAGYLTTGTPFHLVGATPGLVSLAVRRDGAGQRIATWAHGVPQQANGSDSAAAPIVFRQPVIGVINGNEVAWAGDLAEILIYDRALSDDERARTERYLADKFSLPLKPAAQIAREPRARSTWALTLDHLPRTVSWLGNTESGKTSVIQHGIFTSAVRADGTVIACSVWDETHKELGFYRDGASVPGLGRAGGCSAVVIHGDHLYVGMSGMSQPKAGVKRFTLDGADAPWPDLPEGIAFETKAPWQEVCGIAVVGDELFVTTDARDEVLVHDLGSGAAKRAFALPGARRIAGGRDGLWISTADRVAAYDVHGKPTGPVIRDVVAGALALDGKGRLLVGDDGARQQVITYDLAGTQPKEIAALGVKGGVHAGPRPGMTGDDRFLHPGGVGVDAAGNIYVQDMWRIRSFSRDGTPRWMVECTQFCRTATPDPASDGNDWYTGSQHHVAVPGQPPGKDWAWQGYTVDDRRFPELSDGGSHVHLRRLNGGLYRFGIGTGSVTITRRLPDSEIFAPCAMVRLNESMSGAPRPAAAPEAGRWTWCDRDGDGRVVGGEITATEASGSQWSPFIDVDATGGLWEPQGRAGVRHVPLSGFTDGGAPIYDLSALKAYPRPAEFLDVMRCRYIPATDTMYLAGRTWERQQGPGQWVGFTGEIIRYADWSTAKRAVVARVALPKAGMSMSSFDVIPGRDLLFAIEVETAVVFAYDMKAGRLLGIVEPDPDLVGEVGWVDLPGGGIHACERKDGEIVIMCEESYAEKQMVYRLPPGFEKQLPAPRPAKAAAKRATR